MKTMMQTLFIRVLFIKTYQMLKTLLQYKISQQWTLVQ